MRYASCVSNPTCQNGLISLYSTLCAQSFIRRRPQIVIGSSGRFTPVTIAPRVSLHHLIDYYAGRLSVSNNRKLALGMVIGYMKPFGQIDMIN